MNPWYQWTAALAVAAGLLWVVRLVLAERAVGDGGPAPRPVPARPPVVRALDVLLGLTLAGTAGCGVMVIASVLATHG